MARPVPCVTWLTSATRSTRTASPPGPSTPTSMLLMLMLMPTGAIRMAAPLVSPPAPLTSGEAPCSIRARARRVDGPSRSSDPAPAIRPCQSTSSRASASGSSRPPPATRRRPTIRA